MVNSPHDYSWCQGIALELLFNHVPKADLVIYVPELSPIHLKISSCDGKGLHAGVLLNANHIFNQILPPPAGISILLH